MKRVTVWLCVIVIIFGLGIVPGYCKESWQFAGIIDGTISDGYVWTEYNCSDGVSYYVCIDHSGNALLRLAGGITEPAPSRLLPEPSQIDNGYFQIKDVYDSCLTVLDEDGEVTARISYDDEHELAAYGAGYTVLFAKATGFDASGFFYAMYDPYGTIIMARWVDGDVSFGADHGDGLTTVAPSWSNRTLFLSEYIRYCGDGVFYIDGRYYYTKSRTREDVHGDFWFDSNGWSNVGYGSSSMMRMNSEGEIFTVDIPYSFDCCTNFVVGDTYSGEWYAYDINSQEWTALDGKYADRLVDKETHTPVFSSTQIIAVQMIGGDGEHYFAIFDMHWNIIVEPTMGYINEMNDGFLSVHTKDETLVFNEDGEFVLSTASYSPYLGDGIIIDFDKMYDQDGALLFDFNDVKVSKSSDFTEPFTAREEAKTEPPTEVPKKN